MTNVICYVAGHSGGHIIPSATQSKKELNKNDQVKILFFCTKNKLDQQILNNYDFINYKVHLPIYNIPKNPIKILKFIWDFNVSFIKSLLILRKYRPKKIVSMGGLISIPACLAGKLLNIPIELWELNVEPGKTIKLLSKFVDQINICFDETAKYFPSKKCSVVSYPVRFEQSAKSLPKNKIIELNNFSLDKKTVLIIGGSQGSKYLNDIIKELINNKLSEQIQIIHQTGNDNFDWQKFYESNSLKARTFSFYNKMEEFYLIADLVICRSGAGTLAEVLFFEKKCITIPLKTKSTSHQILNAKCLAKKYPNLITVIEQNNDNKAFLFSQINNLAKL